MSEANVVPKWGLRVAVSNVIRRGEVSFRRIALGLPGERAGFGTWNANGGEFSPDVGVDFRIVDGYRVESEAYAATLTAMQEFARALERRFRARAAVDSDHRVDTNHFLPRDLGCSAEPDEIPCLPDYVEASNLDWQRLLGMPARALHTAWGGAIQVSNQRDSRTAGPPYTMALRAATPWGGAIRIDAIQPLD